MTPHRGHLVYAVTSGVTAQAFLRGQMRHMVDRGWSVHVACAATPQTGDLVEREGAELVSLPMRRCVFAPSDAVAVCRAVAWLARLRPGVVCYSTPKAALVFAFAAWVTGVPGRIYLLRGLRLDHEPPGSWRYRAMLSLERWICARSRVVICVSEGLRNRALALGLAERDRLTVLGSGSSNGVDTRRFTRPDGAARRAARARWGIGDEELVIACVGRLVSDKGIVELLQALRSAVHARPCLRDRLVLLVVGDWDIGGPDPQIQEALSTPPVRLVVTGHVTDMPGSLSAADLLVHPSRREGMSNVLLEAAASGLPTVTTDIAGCRDAVRDGLTGLVVRHGDTSSMANAVLRLADDPALRDRLGRAGQRWVDHAFDQSSLWQRYEAVFAAACPEPAAVVEGASA